MCWRQRISVLVHVTYPSNTVTSPSEKESGEVPKAFLELSQSLLSLL